jgi:hypothetical protein
VAMGMATFNTICMLRSLASNQRLTFYWTWCTYMKITSTIWKKNWSKLIHYWWTSSIPISGFLQKWQMRLKRSSNQCFITMKMG